MSEQDEGVEEFASVRLKRDLMAFGDRVLSAGTVGVVADISETGAITVEVQVDDPGPGEPWFDVAVVGPADVERVPDAGPVARPGR